NKNDDLGRKLILRKKSSTGALSVIPQLLSRTRYKTVDANRSHAQPWSRITTSLKFVYLGLWLSATSVSNDHFSYQYRSANIRKQHIRCINNFKLIANN
ncbi:hypothetical protein K0M31_015245, partial [Melipona bicolor]